MAATERRGPATWQRHAPHGDDPNHHIGQRPNKARQRRRRTTGWLLLAAGISIVVIGTITGHGLIMVGGFVLIVAATHLLDTYGST